MNKLVKDIIYKPYGSFIMLNIIVYIPGVLFSSKAQLNGSMVSKSNCASDVWEN